MPNGLTITKIRVPLGVIGIIYEARPNVTADAIGLCMKSGNAVILKGGSEAIHSNTKIADVLRKQTQLVSDLYPSHRRNDLFAVLVLLVFTHRFLYRRNRRSRTAVNDYLQQRKENDQCTRTYYHRFYYRKVQRIVELVPVIHNSEYRSRFSAEFKWHIPDIIASFIRKCMRQFKDSFARVVLGIDQLFELRMFGKVYVASNIKTSELYAIKLVSKI